MIVGEPLLAVVLFSVPLAGGCVTLNVRLKGDSMSEPARLIAFGVSSLTSTDCEFADGASFAGVTVFRAMVAVTLVDTPLHGCVARATQLSGSPRSVTV